MRHFLVLILTALPMASLADVFTFETPSENIQCSVGVGAQSADISCTIIDLNGPAPLPRPANCALDWGHDFALLECGPVEMRCAPLSRNRDGFERANYGVTGRFGGITCLSERTGFQCTNLDGHGFFLSRRVRRVY